MKTILGSLFILGVVLPATLAITILFGLLKILVDVFWVIAALVSSVVLAFSMKD